MMDAFRTADQVLLSGVQGITDLITTPGLINLDFADVKSVMSGAGWALMGIGSARGDNRAVEAAEPAISSPLLEAWTAPTACCCRSPAGRTSGLFEINEAASLVSDAAHADANIIFGAVIDDALGDEVRVTVIAAGFDSGRPSSRKDAGAAAVPGAAAAPALRPGCRRYRRPMAPSGGQPGVGERLVAPQAARGAAAGTAGAGGHRSASAGVRAAARSTAVASPFRRCRRSRARSRAVVRCPTRTSRKSSTSRSSSSG